MPRLRRKRTSNDTDVDDVLKFMRESEDRLVAGQDKLLAEVKTMNELFGKLIHKL